jgi:autotransporter-associated beta strand protein
VTFDAAGAGQPSVDLQGALFPEYITVDATSDYTFMTTAGGRISGATGLTKNNSGSLTILTDNNNSGLIDINAGTVTVGDGAASAHIGDGGFANDGTLIFNHATDENRVVGPISGSGSVTKNGASELAIAGDATYTGATTIGAGAGLSFGNGGAVATIATPTINNDGTLIYNSSSDHTLAATVSGSGGLTKRGTGNLTVSTLGTGDTTVEAGTLTLGAENILGGALTIDGDDATLDLAGFDQAVTGLTGIGNGLITNTAASGTNVLTIDAAANSGMNVLINEAEGGSNVIMVVKSGAGVLDRNSPAGSSTYSGGTLINGPGGFNIDQNDQLGTGPVIFDGGFITMNDQNDLFNPVTVLTEANYESRGNIQFRGPFTGDSSAVINMRANANGRHMTFDPGSAMDDFHGTVNYDVNEFQVRARFRTDINGSDVTWNMGTNGTLFMTRDGQDVRLGHVIGDNNSRMAGATSSDNPTTYIIGEKNMDINWTGQIADGEGPAEVRLNRYVSIVKEGTGTMTMGGTNAYSGPTTVNGGTLNVTAVGGLENSRAILVNGTGVLDTAGMGGTLNLGTTTNAQTVGGSGTIQGDVVAGATGVVTVAPGASAGELTITGSLTLAANSVVEMELDKSATPTSDLITAASITEAGTLNVTNIGPILQAGDVFTLFSEAVSGFTAVNLPAEDTFAEYTWTDNLATDGTIEVATVTPKASGTPADITFAVSGGGTSLDLSWPATHLGQFLETNAVGVADAASWFEVPGSDASNTISIPINPDEPQVYFRLRSP